MKRIALAALLAPLVVANSHAAEWLTVYGYPSEAGQDLVEVSPLARQEGAFTVLDVRVSRANPRTSYSGRTYRSHVATVEVDCSARRAWYRQITYYARPLWHGDTFTSNYERGKAEMLFNNVPDRPLPRVIAAACKDGAGQTPLVGPMR